jgi:hypothetical protein
MLGVLYPLRDKSEKSIDGALFNLISFVGMFDQLKKQVNIQMKI